jgi:hypothetical protein
MVRLRTATEALQNLEAAPVRKALRESHKLQDAAIFRRSVEMRNPSRSYFVRDGGKLHSLKAVVTYALREHRPKTLAKDFHAKDAAARLRSLGFDVVHNPASADRERERAWIRRLARPRQIAFRERLLDLYGSCPLSGCTTPQALEAAHVDPVSSGGCDLPSNGILLRADLHKLFDSDLIAVDPADGRVHVATGCGPEYRESFSSVIFAAPTGGPVLHSFGARWKRFLKSEPQE